MCKGRKKGIGGKRRKRERKMNRQREKDAMNEKEMRERERERKKKRRKRRIKHKRRRETKEKKLCGLKLGKKKLIEKKEKSMVKTGTEMGIRYSRIERKGREKNKW